MSFRLRPAVTAEAHTIAKMHARSRSSAYRGLVPDEYLDHEMLGDLMPHWEARMKEVERGAALVLVCEPIAAEGTADREPVAFVCMSLPDDDASVYIDNLHAMPGHKGAGLGSMMLDAAERWARDHGATHMHLLVIEGNDAAIGFYEHRGWTMVSRDIDKMGRLDVPALRYSLAIA